MTNGEKNPATLIISLGFYYSPRFARAVKMIFQLILKLLYFSNCPDDWVDLGSRHGCFYFAAEAGNMDWFEALDYCNTLNPNAFLAEIRTKPTQELVAEYADSIADHGWWLGGADFFGVIFFPDG